ncbi:MAG: SRPBCC domain-containing protein [Actinomycetota bacterium]|nr:SRPBCC domain-containing protein [Actinomycetota bacterium]
MEKVFDIYIRTTPDDVWEAISDGEIRRKYTFQPPPDLEGNFATGETVEADPPHRLVETMKAEWSPDVARHPATTITWEVTPWREGICHVRVTHGGLREDASGELYGGWPHILSSLKSLLETGEALDLRIPAEAVERWRSAKAGA